ncbi:MAG: hypothetical protein PHR87_13765 [Sulfurospirillaceae bacterium]|nr:hypothetical protein [Sulfurospirillaceae bacterium]
MTRTEYEAACERATELSEKIQNGVDLSEDERIEFDGLIGTIEHYEEQASV